MTAWCCCCLLCCALQDLHYKKHPRGHTVALVEVCGILLSSECCYKRQTYTQSQQSCIHPLIKQSLTPQPNAPTALHPCNCSSPGGGSWLAATPAQPSWQAEQPPLYVLHVPSAEDSGPNPLLGRWLAEPVSVL